jgi:hypothetical protein
MRSLFLQHDPASHARMLQPGARHKFAKVHHPPTDDELVNHLAGTSTIAIPLISPADLAYHAAADIDIGGETALRRCINAAVTKGYTCFGITSRTQTHDGGHLWMIFDTLTHPERLRQCMQQILTAAQVETREVYPVYQSLRLPFGQHTWTRRRGRLLLPDGKTIDLDAGMAAISTGLNELAAASRNQVQYLPQLEDTLVSKTGRFVRGGAGPIAAYNQTTNLVTLLEGYGGHVADRSRQGILMHCPCGQHAHDDEQPSLWLQPARRPEIHGDMIAVGLAPRCRFYTSRGQVINAFNVFCIMEERTPAEAVEQLRAQEVH